MQENIDYVFAENVKSVDKENIREIFTGLFVGTKDYFFFFPEKAQLHEQSYALDTITNTSFTYKGKSVPEYVLEVLSLLPKAKEFEEFVTGELMRESNGEIKVFPMSDLSEFKVQASVFGSGVNVRFANKEYSGMQKFTATPVAFKLGKKKKSIKAFYQNHPKIVAK
ncbi:MAG: hypothetical protein ACFHU9_09465 [Fluviicola sp.]|jgi:hypothetical protein